MILNSIAAIDHHANHLIKTIKKIPIDCKTADLDTLILFENHVDFQHNFRIWSSVIKTIDNTIDFKSDTLITNEQINSSLRKATINFMTDHNYRIPGRKSSPELLELHRKSCQDKYS